MKVRIVNRNLEEIGDWEVDPGNGPEIKAMCEWWVIEFQGHEEDFVAEWGSLMSDLWHEQTGETLAFDEDGWLA